MGLCIVFEWGYSLGWEIRDEKVGIVGHFGFGYDLLNGQTIKVKILFHEFQKQLGTESTMAVDTHGGAKKAPAMIAGTIKCSSSVKIAWFYRRTRAC